MNKYAWLLVTTLTASLLRSVIVPECQAAEANWKAGVARVDITPEGPYWMGGYASRKRPSEGTLLPLSAKALILESQGQRFAILTLDLLVITSKLERAVSARVEIEHGVRRSHLLLNCSHTHCGPEIRLYRDTLHNIPSVYVRKMHQYVKTLEDKLVKLVGQAVADSQPARLSVSQSSAVFAINRRNNREQQASGLRATGKLKGPVDHAVPVLHVVDEKGKSKAIVFGYACHNTVLSIFQTSGDYAGFAQKIVEEKHPGALAMFVMGAGGDQNPSPRRRVEYAAQHGKALAAAVDRALSGHQTAVSSKLRVARAVAPLEFQPHADRATLEKQQQSSNPYQRWKANFVLSELDAGRELSRKYDLPVQVAALGDELLLIAIGGESVVDYSLRAKQKHQRSGGPLVWFAGYSNDVFGYLPSLRVLKEGGYEGGGHMVYTKFPGPFTDTVETRVLDVIDSLVEQVTK